jgi:uncharacterized protein YndB with AHSA1/START domain
MTFTHEPLTLSRTVKATCEKVFHAWTNASLLAKWFCPQGDWNCVMEAEARLGGTYRFHMKSPEDTYIVSGEYIEFEPPSRLVFTWGWENDALDDAKSRVTVTISESEGGSQVTVVHERLGNEESVLQHSKGWESVLNRLETFWD